MPLIQIPHFGSIVSTEAYVIWISVDNPERKETHFI